MNNRVEQTTAECRVPFVLENASTIFAKNSALVSDKTAIDYECYNQVSKITANLIKSASFRQGDRVAICDYNSIEYCIFLMALLRIGIIAIPICTRLPQKIIIESLERIECNAIITPTDFNSLITGYTIKKYQLTDFVSNCENVSVKKIEAHGKEEREKHLSFHRVATILFTSGSSGNPKAVGHTYANHYYSAVGANENIPFQSGDCWLLSLPLYHIGGFAILFRAALGGGTVVVPPEKMRLSDAIQQFNITHISLVSTQLYKILQEKHTIKALSMLKAIVLGGGLITPSLIRRAIELRLPVYTSYGSTEAASQVTTTRTFDRTEKSCTAGKSLKYQHIKIADDGEILIKGETLFKGYVERNRIISAVDKNGWFKTGDIGYIDDEGYLTVTGRKDNMFISGGENIYPEEIEQALSEHPDVENSVVISIPDEEYGARPGAFIQLRYNKPLNKAMIREFLLQRLPSFKIPDYFWKMPEYIIRDNNLKSDRKMLAEIARKRL
jgi:O-succinylbenzoic acid--CoA ligase